MLAGHPVGEASRSTAGMITQFWPHLKCARGVLWTGGARSRGGEGASARHASTPQLQGSDAPGEVIVSSRLAAAP